MTKIIAAAAALLICASALLVWQISRPQGHIVEIVQDGRVIEKIDLDLEKAPRRIVIKAPDGGSNTLLIKDRRIRVESADCRGRNCVKMGWLRSAALPLVCLPHRLTVRFADSVKDSLDGISQ